MEPGLGLAETFDASLRSSTRAGATVVAVAALVATALALIGEILRRRRRGSALVRLVDRVVPRPVMLVAAAIVSALTISTVGIGSASAAATTPGGPPLTGLRSWLEHPVVRIPRPPARVAAAPRDLATPPTINPHPLSVATTTTSTSTSPPASSAPPTGEGVLLVPPLAVSNSARRVVHGAPAAVAPARPIVGTHTVRGGECLWAIARAQLGATATNLAVDRAWRRIYRVNEALIGGDPNLIMPGWALALPPLDDLR
jgi:resuscitation-promoting factor RpfA